MRNKTNQFDDHTHYTAKILGVDRDSDLALLKIEAKKLPTLAFFDSDKLKQGQVVMALGKSAQAWRILLPSATLARQCAT